MSALSAQWLSVLLAAAAALHLSCAANPSKCAIRGSDGKIVNVTCDKSDPYCCRSSRSSTSYYCCDDCEKSLKSDDCDSSSLRYIGYVFGGLALLIVVTWFTCVVAKKVKSTWCKNRSSVVDSSPTATPSSSVEYPRNILPAPSPAPVREPQVPPEKPPEYFELFPVSPPPAYDEGPHRGF